MKVLFAKHLSEWYCDTLWEVSPLHGWCAGPRSSSLGLKPGRSHCLVFLGHTLDSYGASLHPCVLMGTGEFNARG